ncbi:hypothetical protein TYRP_016798 [Tyrophagus putrescentiae]|nr:hypothetical protein TYRP_016798 [Tyrophagus putrescentiae]
MFQRMAPKTTPASKTTIQQRVIAETEKRVKQVQASPQKSQPLITSPPPPTPTPPPSSLSSSFSSPSPSPSPSQSAAKKSKFFTAEVIQAATRRQPCVIKNCPDRMRMFEQDELNFHIRQAHNGRDIICMATPMCMETFRRGVDLTRHLNTVHEDIKEFACCGIVFSEYSRYWTHYVTCHQEKDYQCPRCPFTTKLLRLLDRHCFLNHENFRSGTPGSGKKGIFTSTGKPVESIKEEQ